METINELRDYIEECHDLKEAYKLGFWHDYFTSELIRCQNIHKLRTGSFHKLEVIEQLKNRELQFNTKLIKLQQKWQKK